MPVACPQSILSLSFLPCPLATLLCKDSMEDASVLELGQREVKGHVDDIWFLV